LKYDFTRIDLSIVVFVRLYGYFLAISLLLICFQFLDIFLYFCSR